VPEESDRELRTRTVLVIVMERFACMASTRLPVRPINRRSPTRGSCSLSPLAYPFTKFLPEQRVDQDGMIQSLDRSSTSTSTKNSQNKTNQDRGPDCSGAPPTPPSMRVRPRWFNAQECGGGSISRSESSARSHRDSPSHSRQDSRWSMRVLCFDTST